MPATTRYSATFDRPYEESPPSDNATGARRSRSHSLQVNVSPYTPLAYAAGSRQPLQQRSSSTDSGGSKGAAENNNIPTRLTSKPVVKTHNNPFQFVKVGSCPLYRKAEDQIKKVKEVVKQPEVLEEEEEWQSNLDSWKSRRRKMSEDIFRRQEEIRQFESEEQLSQANSKKIKTFSEMVESRAHRGRTMSLCLISSPLELQQWELENQNKRQLFSEESEENSAVNSEDEGVNDRRLFQKNTNGSTNGNPRNGSAKNKINKMFELGENCSPLKDGIYCDSGLESISSSHRTGDTPDSCSDFSQDSGSSIDCDSPRASGLMHAMNLLEEYNSKSLHHSDSSDSFPNTKSSKKTVNGEINGQSIQNGNEKTQPNGNVCEMANNKEQFTRKNGNSMESSTSELSTDDGLEDSVKRGKHERSIESENEVFVDDFEELDTNGCAPSNQKLEKDSDFTAKRATAKVVSVEINNRKADPNIKTPEAVQEEPLSVVFRSSTLNNNSAPVPKAAPCSKVVLNDVLPVEQIAEEMEKLILQQLEEEERAKELSSKPTAFEIAPPTKAEPPKEKPPPPPSAENEVPKTRSLKRIDSTKRIKKEIHKRRSNFLGIEADEGLVCDDSVAPPPNALEQILKAEMELDRESMKRLDSAAAERLKFEENEIIEKEREIIATLETEEMQKELVISEESCNILPEVDRIQKLKEERKRIESEKTLNEAQLLRLAEEKQLREREEFIRRQEEVNDSSAELSPPLLSDAGNLLNAQTSPNASSLSSETQLNVSGDGNTVSNSASQVLDAKNEKPAKPAVPPKPIKKKEAIRKERERLRQEQEALQREREEHRLKQQELLKSSQKPNAPASRLGPVPPAKPSPKLTLSNNSQPSARENVIFTSQSYHGAQNGISSRNGCGEIQPPVVSKHKPIPSQKKVTQNDYRVQQKAPIIRKPSQDSSPESKYNQNHWLIQEAEMRRIAELKERQQHQYPPMHQDNNKARQPQDKVWNYARPSVIKPHDGSVLGMYPPPPPAKPSRVVALESHDEMLSVSGRKKCSHCLEELSNGLGAAMIIESLQLCFHIQCFQCCVCKAQLGNGSCGADVRVRNNKLHCQNCYSNDEAGLQFSQV